MNMKERAVEVQAVIASIINYGWIKEDDITFLSDAAVKTFAQMAKERGCSQYHISKTYRELIVSILKRQKYNQGWCDAVAILTEKGSPLPEPKYMEVFWLRMSKTLEEVGREKNVTRERIRQLEFKAKRALLEELSKYPEEKDKIKQKYPELNWR